MKTLTKMSLLALAATLLASGSAFAEYGSGYVVKRIDHPNGPPTFATVPVEPRSTIAVYVEGRSFGRPVVVERDYLVREDELVTRPIPIHRGRGETIYVREPVR